MKFILVLLSSVYGGYAPTTITQPYESKEACEAAGASFGPGENWTQSRLYRCIPAPK